MARSQEEASCLASRWARWLEVSVVSRDGGGFSQPRLQPSRRVTVASAATRESECVRRFSPRDDQAGNGQLHEPSQKVRRCQGQEIPSVHAWLCPRPLEVLPSKTPTAFRRHSAPNALTGQPSLATRSALRRESAIPGQLQARRVSFHDTPEVQDLSPRARHSAEMRSPVPAHPEQTPQPMAVLPSDEAFAAFRVKDVLDQVEPVAPQGSLRVHVPKAPRYHAPGPPGHHYHSTVAPRAAIVDAEAPLYADPDGVAVLRTRFNEAQGPQSRMLRKAPHFKIRIRRAFSRGLVHHHHHHHHNGPVVISDVGQVLPPVVVHVRPPEILPASGANVVPAPVEPPSTPLTAAALQRHEALMQQQQVDHSASDAMAQAGIPASLSLGMSMHQGAVFGVVSTIAVEAMQITLAEKRGNVADQTASIASAAMRGAVVGAAGGGMALMLGPTAPTAIFVGYGLMREWMAQGYSWVHNEITGPVALNRAVEVSGSAAGGVAGAMAAATLLSGFGGVVVAAAAGCSGFAGSLGGREVASVCFDLLSSERMSRSRSSGSGMSSSSRRSSRKSSRRRSKGWMPSEPQLLEAYSLLGVDPCCSNTELKHAFRRAVVLQDDAGCAPFRDVLRAMERIRSTRQTPLELDIRNLDSGTHENSRSCRSSLGATSLESDSQLASFIGGMAAHPASGVSF